MTRPLRIAAFGALKSEGYKMFSEHLERQAVTKQRLFTLTCAGPYPNAQGQAEPGRPLRAMALADPSHRRNLIAAVVSDGCEVGADTADIACMPCLSMVGFHEEIEQSLGRPLLSLAAVLRQHYAKIEHIGILHMRPARAVIADLFGTRAVTPTPEQEQRLLSAEERAREEKSSRPIEDVMADIVQNWHGAGLTSILLARADAPLAEKIIPPLPGVQVDSYFSLLAGAVFAAP